MPEGTILAAAAGARRNRMGTHIVPSGPIAAIGMVAKKDKHQTTRTSNYTEMKDEALIKAWESITLDGMTRTNQTGKWYWQ
jgi:hypothetical protein